MASEFELISKYFTRQDVQRDDVALGIGDDAALLRVPVGQSLAVSIDTLVEGVHFLADMPARDVGYRALAVNLSDLAAMGARPAWATLAITLPRADETWLAEFSAGFFELAKLWNVQLVGGNTTRGPLAISVQVHGFVPESQALRRSGACVGDLIYVTGTLGDAALGLRSATEKLAASTVQTQYVQQRYARPTPRIDEGIALHGLAHACIDISDGLLADLGHMCAASGVGAQINVEQLPLSDAFRAARADWQLALSGGDDYELCFTIAPSSRAAIEQRFRNRVVGVTCIGVVEAVGPVRCTLNDGSAYVSQRRGYDHFAPGTR